MKSAFINNNTVAVYSFMNIKFGKELVDYVTNILKNSFCTFVYRESHIFHICTQTKPRTLKALNLILMEHEEREEEADFMYKKLIVSFF